VAVPGREAPQPDGWSVPGLASMAQGQDREPEAPEEDPVPVPAGDDGLIDPEDQPEQPGLLVTGAEAAQEQQRNPELKDNSGARP
jgi:hypothetical protein